MLKLNVSRIFKAPVPLVILDEDGNDKAGEFSATFKIMSRKQAKRLSDKPLLDVVLVAVHDLELTDDNDQVLTGDELLEAAKGDPSLSTALVSSYWSNIVKKAPSKT